MNDLITLFCKKHKILSNTDGIIVSEDVSNIKYVLNNVEPSLCKPYKATVLFDRSHGVGLLVGKISKSKIVLSQISRHQKQLQISRYFDVKNDTHKKYYLDELRDKMLIFGDNPSIYFNNSLMLFAQSYVDLVYSITMRVR